MKMKFASGVVIAVVAPLVCCHLAFAAYPSFVWKCNSPTAGTQYRVGADVPTAGTAVPGQTATSQQGEIVAGTWTGIGASPAVQTTMNGYYWTNPAPNFKAVLNGAGGVGFRVKLTAATGATDISPPVYTVIP